MKLSTIVALKGFTKLADVSVMVPRHGPGNVIDYKPITFEIYRQENRYKAVSTCSDVEKRLTRLPPELSFQIKNNRMHIFRYEHRDLIKDMVRELVKAKKIDLNMEHLPVICQKMKKINT